MAHRRSKPPWKLPKEKVLLQLFVRGNPFRAGKNSRENWPELVQQLIGQQRLAGLVVYGSPYLWQELQALLPTCLLYTSPSPRDGLLSRMPSSA